MTTETVTWLTQDAYDRLKAELDQLSGPGRVELARKIEAAREEGDLKENGGYHAAKEEQGKQEARIRQLNELLRHAKVGEPPANDGAVHPGSIVTIRFADGDTERFLLGSREVEMGDLEVYSEKSPLGSAILDHKIGDVCAYELPNGRKVEVSIVDVEPFTG
ncbi:transcription elongation factor GreA [Sporichthya brevicatena]|uniref:Transcription elongation factor GreA n=1 Tax=Sporichthya brevicatena TaxID=171442 RepID=A0ABN1GJK6_9ACTN